MVEWHGFTGEMVAGWGRSLALASYELLFVDPPPARAYTDFCHRCWPEIRVNELASADDDETTSTGEECDAGDTQ